MDQQFKFRQKNTTIEITAEYILHLFERMSDQDVRIVGFDPQKTHPKWMILTILPVPPLDLDHKLWHQDLLILLKMA
jgi:DNA-directed RNA polymerase beta' subunit